MDEDYTSREPYKSHVYELGQGMECPSESVNNLIHPWQECLETQLTWYDALMYEIDALKRSGFSISTNFVRDHDTLLVYARQYKDGRKYRICFRIALEILPPLAKLILTS